MLASSQGFHFLEVAVVHHSIQLPADLPVQLGDMMVEQGFVELFNLLAGLFQALKENLNRRGHALIGGGIGQALAVLPGIDIAKRGDRVKVNFFKQRGVDAAGGFQHLRVASRRRRGVLNRHQHFSQ